ncbi:MAG: DUF4290 domain-containing protein [Bacteroidota bacterium]
MDYNTQRKKLFLPEYGRHIQKMVDHVKSIEDREERNKLAKELIAIMGNLNPHFRDVADFKHKLWDHLLIMSDFDLDIDFPYEVIKKEVLTEKPRKIAYAIGEVKLKHYGRNLEKFIDYAANKEEGEEKQLLIAAIANHMKKSYLMWNKEAVLDQVIFDDIKKLSQGRISVDSTLKLNEVRDILARNKKPKKIQRKK